MTTPLDRAFDRLDDFLAVQASASPAALLDAVERLQESVGVDDAARGRIAARLDALRLDAQAGPLTLGLVLGLLAAELD